MSVQACEYQKATPLEAYQHASSQQCQNLGPAPQTLKPYISSALTGCGYFYRYATGRAACPEGYFLDARKLSTCTKPTSGSSS